MNLLRLLQMSGTNNMPETEQRLLRLETVFSRKVPLNTLASLTQAISSPPKNLENIGSAAIALDANVILRLPSHSKGPDVIDYLGQRFTGPLILPAQAVQEFWNNNLSVIDTVGNKLKKQFDGLQKEAKQLGPEFHNFSDRIDTLLNEFDQQFGYIYDESTIHKVKSFLETLEQKAYLSTIDRMRFFPIAKMRMMTKTPPGYRDSGDGDFYIWIELLYGAMKAMDEGNKYDRLILITDDAKPDWVRDGVPHPILAAEANELLGVPFEIWKLNEFISAVGNELS